MKKVWNRVAMMFGRGTGIWSSHLALLAVAVFVNRFGQGIFGGARTNFFVDTLGITGGQVLALADASLLGNDSGIGVNLKLMQNLAQYARSRR